MSDIVDIYMKNEKCYAATIELCTTCNWKCKHCYLDDHGENGMAGEAVIELLGKLRNFGVYEITFTGGEIFTRLDCLTIIEKAREMGFAVKLLSNVSLLNEECIKRLKNLKIEGIDCTIFSMNADVHDRFVQKDGALKVAINNILRLKEEGIPVLVKCILTKYNWESYKEIKQFGIQNGIDTLFTLSLFPKRSGDKSPIDLTVPMKYWEQIIRDTDKNGGYSYKGATPEDYICKSARYNLVIEHNGNVKLCGNHPAVIGNIFKQPLEELWNSKEAKRIRNYKVKDTIKCFNCKLKERCYNCAGVCEQVGETSLGCLEIDCELAKIRKRCFS